MSTKKTKKRRNRKVSFFSIMRQSIKEAYHKYKNDMHNRAMEHKLLSSKSDWTMLEQFIQDINDNPKLKVDITLNDLTKIHLYCYDDKQSIRDYELLDNTRSYGPEYR